MDESLLTGESVLTAAESDGGGGGTGTVTSVSAGPGISVTGTVTDPIVNNTGAISVASADPGIVVSPTSGAVQVKQVMVATWPTGAANRRLYLVDSVNGIDTNPGFLDGGSANFPISAATVAATAKKTLGALSSIFPRVGAGRSVEVIIAAGTYATTSLDSFLNGSSGWASGYPVVRATGTNATAGATAFAGDAADCTYLGASTGAGMNAAGYNPTAGATTTNLPCQQVGGAGAAFPAEPAKPLGLRIRFDSATATPGLANVCRGIAQVASATTLIPTTALPAAPGPTDVFYIEQAGAIVPGFSLGGNGTVPTVEQQFAGIASTGTVTLRDGRFAMGFCDWGAFNASNTQACTLSQTYAHPTLGTLTVGIVRNSSITTTACRQDLGGAIATGTVTITSPLTLQCLLPGAAGTGLVVAASGMVTDLNLSLGNTINLTSPIRILSTGSQEAGLSLNSGNIALSQVQVTGAGAKPAVKIEGGGRYDFGATSGSTPSLMGATGNNDVGLDVTLARGAIITISPTQTPTITGALGDVRLSIGLGVVFAGGAVVSWADIIAAGGITDAAGNRFVVASSFGTGVQGNSQTHQVAKFSGLVADSEGGAFFSYLADVGSEIVAPATQLEPILYPTSLRLITKLRGVALFGTGPNPPTFTLYKDGAPTAMAFTLPPSTAGPVKGFDVAHPVLFEDGSSYDVRVDFAGPAGGDTAVSATIEGPC